MTVGRDVLRPPVSSGLSGPALAPSSPTPSSATPSSPGPTAVSGRVGVVGVACAAPVTQTIVAADAFDGTPGPVRAAAVASSASSQAALPALPQRRLPPLREAIADPTVTPLPWSSVPVPDAVVDVLRNARRVLVVGHVPPDGDCVASAAGLVAALRAVGKDAVAVVDDALPAACRAIDGAGRVQRAADVDGPFDVVVLVDVAQVPRIGGAAAFLGQAGHVVVVDHHEDVPARSTFGVRDDQGLTSWVASSADAAAVLVGGIAAALSAPAIAAAEKTLAAGLYTDTLGFRAPGADRRTLQLFKTVVGDTATLDALERSLQPRLPPAATAIIDTLVAGATMHKGSKSPVVVVDAPAWQALGVAARAADAQMTDGDLRGVLCDRLDALRDKHGAAMMLIEEPQGVRLSTRSIDDGFARTVAEHLGGGGHGRAAGGFVRRPLRDVEGDLARALDAVTLAQQARVRAGRLPARTAGSA